MLGRGSSDLRSAKGLQGVAARVPYKKVLLPSFSAVLLPFEKLHLRCFLSCIVDGIWLFIGKFLAYSHFSVLLAISEPPVASERGMRCELLRAILGEAPGGSSDSLEE